MKRMPAGKFKAQCLAVMAQIQATGEPVIVTKRGAPVVKVVAVRKKKNSIFGCMKGKAEIIGDIESPIPVEWGTPTE